MYFGPFNSDDKEPFYSILSGGAVKTHTLFHSHYFTLSLALSIDSLCTLRAGVS